MTLSAKQRRLITVAGILLGLIVAVGVVLFVLWSRLIYWADAEKLQTFYETNADSIVVHEYSNYWEIAPKTTECADEVCSNSLTTGFIYYPGAFVDPQAYFYKLDFLANGQPFKSKLFITKPPLNLAILGKNQASEIIEQNPSIQNWKVGGHSLGGAMACEYTATHSQQISALVLFGSYCATDISSTSIKVTSIRGTEDGVLNMQNYTNNLKFLPTSFKESIIIGMNHAQAGNYGDQRGDNPSTKADEDVKVEIKEILSSQ